MKELSKEDIIKNRVDTIDQYKILDYLKKNLNINEFKIFLIDENSIKIEDRNFDILYFGYDKANKEVIYDDEPISFDKCFEIGR